MEGGCAGFLSQGRIKAMTANRERKYLADFIKQVLVRYTNIE
jgi:hypothetical protein